MTAKHLIEQMNELENSERIAFLKHLYHEHFDMNPITEKEAKIIEDLRDGYVRVVDNNEV